MAPDPTGGRRRFPAGTLAAVGAGGAVGTLLRAWVGHVWPSGGGFPWATFTVNLTGALVLGFLVVFPVERLVPSRFVHPLMGAGFCGGLTTFSTLAVEVDLLVKAGRIGVAVVYVVASLTAGVAAGWAGMLLARAG